MPADSNGKGSTFQTRTASTSLSESSYMGPKYFILKAHDIILLGIPGLHFVADSPRTVDPPNFGHHGYWALSSLLMVGIVCIMVIFGFRIASTVHYSQKLSSTSLRIKQEKEPSRKWRLLSTELLKIPSNALRYKLCIA